MDRPTQTIYLLLWIRWIFLVVLFVLVMAVYACASLGTAAGLLVQVQPAAGLARWEIAPASVLGLSMMLTAVLAAGGLVAGVAHWRERRQCAEAEAKEDGEPFVAVPLILAFEPEYAVMWDTQLPALTLIRSAGPCGIPSHRLCAWYVKTSRRYPELYDGSSFRQWTEFLSEARLIRREEGKILLTAEGKEFLEYMASQRTLSGCTDGNAAA